MLLFTLLFSPAIVIADGGHDDTDIHRDGASSEVSGLNRLLDNRIIYLVVSLVLMTLLTWGVFALSRVRPPTPKTQPEKPA